MTTIDFYTRCADPLAVAARLVVKAWGQFGAVRGLAHREGVARWVVGVAHVVHTRQHRAEVLAVGHHAADGGAADVHPVVAAIPADDAGALALAPQAVVGQRDLQRGLDRLRA